MLSAIVGAALVVASIYIFALAMLAFRNPTGPAWREKYLVLETLACVIVSLFFFGLALLLEFALRFAPPINLALAAAILVLLWPLTKLIWASVGVQAKVLRFKASAGQAQPVSPAAKAAETVRGAV
jgi:hypothetical protein